MFGEDLDSGIYNSIETIKSNRSRGGLFQRHKYMFILLPIILTMVIFGYFVFLRPSNKHTTPIINTPTGPTGTGSVTSTTQHQEPKNSLGVYKGLKAEYPDITDKSFSTNKLHLSLNSLESAAAVGSMKMAFKTTKFYSSFNLDSAHETITVHDIKTKINNKDVSTVHGSDIPNKISVDIKGNEEVNKKTDSKGYFYEIEIKFHVKITDSMKGFYRSQGADGSYILSTQFEPNYAKYAFPSFDNPALKAKFTLKLTAPNDLTVLGNTSVKNQAVDKHNQHLQTTEFEETPLMSTYLSAWAIGNFNSIKGTTNRGLKVGIYTDRESTEELEWALECAIKAIEHYEKVLGVEYVLPKIDMLSIPNFEAGAMENWGLVTYREVAILASKQSDVYTKIYVATVIIHELAHQWFGNLVTLKNWNNLWLNEGFASIFENIVLEDIFASKSKDIGFFKNLTKKGLTIRALAYDGQSQVRALTPKNLATSKINQIFDSVAYAKGGSVLYALKFILKDDLFYKFLNKYLNKHKFDNVTFEMFRDDLREVYSELVSNKEIDVTSLGYSLDDLIKALEDIVYKEGVPLLENQTNHISLEEVVVNFTQKRYAVLNSSDSVIRNYWHIPVEVTVYFKDGTQFSQIAIIPAAKTFKIKYSFEKVVKTVMVNQTGELYSMPKFYTPTDMQHALMLKDENIDMLRSYLNYVPLWLNSKQLSIKGLFKLIYSIVEKYLRSDKHLKNKSVLVELVKLGNFGSSTLISYLKKHLPETEKELIKAKEIFRRVFTKINTERIKLEKMVTIVKSMELEEQAYISSFNLTVISALIMSDDKTTIDKYAAMFYNGNYDPNESSLVYSSVVKSGNPKETYEKFISMLKDKNTPVERLVEIMMLLGSFDDEELMKRTLQIAFYEKKFIKNQDRIYVLVGLARNPKFTEKVLDIIEEKWGYLKSVYGGSGMVGEFITLFGLSSKLETIEKVKKLVGNDEAVAVALKNAVERIMINYEYDEYNRDALTIPEIIAK